MKDYILGFITAFAVMIALWSMTSPLQADGQYTSGGPSGNSWDPIYVKVVDQMTDEMYNLLYIIETLTQCMLYIFLCITCCVWIRRSK